MIHLVLHLAAPVAVAVAFYRPIAGRAALALIATMAVDLDHLWADPVYDPERCSIGLHPLHSWGAIATYATVFALTVLLADWLAARGRGRWRLAAQLAALGLLVHMALDLGDCVI